MAAEKNHSRLLQYTLVGSVGFLLDAGILTLLAQFCDFNVYFSRLVSFSCAMSATWYLNRRFTFAFLTSGKEASLGEYGRYSTVQVIGALINLIVFTAVILIYPALQSIPVIPLAIGALFGLIFNFVGSRFWVFAYKES